LLACIAGKPVLSYFTFVSHIFYLINFTEYICENNIKTQKYKTPVKELNLPAYSFKIKEGEGDQRLIFDPIRRRYIVLTPEEWVRQHFINFLVNHRSYPAALIGVEVTFRLNDLSRRVDLMVYNRLGNPLLVVECKSPDIKISKDVFDQVIEYNMKFKLDYLLITNGISHYGLKMDSESGKFEFLSDIPYYGSLV
jgi:hypothetical protein